jgi:sulfatase maturation enzyme AslB (radical SAM superfamily)
MFTPDHPFAQTEVPKECERCDFRALCGR